MNDEQRIFLTRLKDATATQHKKLESTRLSVNLMKHGVSLENYADYLVHMRNVIAWCEHNIFPTTTPLFKDIARRRKLPLIEADLAILRAASVTGSMPRKTYHAKADDSLPAALGHMYVIVGSTLGGRMILNHLEAALGLDAENGAAFFAGYQADTGTLWKDFLKIFSRYAVENNCEDEVIAGAENAFAGIENYFA